MFSCSSRTDEACPVLGAESRRAAEPQGRRAAGPQAGAAPQRLHVLRSHLETRGAGRGGASLRGDVTIRRLGARPQTPGARESPAASAAAAPPRRPAAPPSGCISPNLCRGEPARPLEGLKGTPQVPAVWPQEDPSMDASRRGKGPPSRAPAGCPAPSDVGSASPPRARALPGPCLVVGVASDPSTSCLGLLQPRKPCLRAPQVRSLAQSLLPGSGRPCPPEVGVGGRPP